MKRVSISQVLVFVMLIVCITVVSACGAPKVSSGQPETPPVTTLPVPEPEPEPEPEPVIQAPLTGLAWEGEEENLNQRPIAVMVNNDIKARPQSGLSAADVLIEVMAEGGITRIVAVFHSQLTEYTGEVGPVRSIRPYLIELGESYGAMLVHAGASNDAYAILQRQNKENLDEISNAGAYFWRDSSRRAPHNLYTNLENLKKGLDKKGYADTADVPVTAVIQEQTDEETIPAISTIQKETANQATITFLKNGTPVEYQYDANQDNYIRYVDGQPHVDKVTSKGLRADNVIVVAAPHRVLDNVGRLDVDLEQGGEAVWLHKGEAVNGEWIRDGFGPIQFAVDGQVMDIGKGVSHILIVPTDGGMSSHVSLQ